MHSLFFILEVACCFNLWGWEEHAFIIERLLHHL